MMMFRAQERRLMEFVCDFGCEILRLGLRCRVSNTAGFWVWHLACQDKLWVVFCTLKVAHLGVARQPELRDGGGRESIKRISGASTLVEFCAGCKGIFVVSARVFPGSVAQNNFC